MVDVDSGAVSGPLTSAHSAGASWSSRGVIVYTGGAPPPNNPTRALWWIPAEGGAAHPLTGLVEGEGDFAPAVCCLGGS